jgi:transcription elongation factor GreA
MLKQKPIYVTKQGFARLEEELNYLRTVKRPELVEYLSDAKGNGDWVDNTEYLLLENELAFVDGRIQLVDHMIRNAQLIEPGNADNIVDIGETVLIQLKGGELEQYTIVGVAETDPGHSFISNESPLGQALVGHKIGDEVTFKTPDGEHRCRIIAITG